MKLVLVMTGPKLALHSVGVRVRVRVREVGVRDNFKSYGNTGPTMATTMVPGPVMAATTSPPDQLIMVDECCVAVEGVALQCFFISFSFCWFSSKGQQEFWR